MRRLEPEPGIEEQLWYALFYTCAVYRGVLPHPTPWPWTVPPVGYVARVDRA